MTIACQPVAGSVAQHMCMDIKRKAAQDWHEDTGGNWVAAGTPPTETTVQWVAVFYLCEAYRVRTGGHCGAPSMRARSTRSSDKISNSKSIVSSLGNATSIPGSR